MFDLTAISVSSPPPRRDLPKVEVPDGVPVDVPRVPRSVPAPVELNVPVLGLESPSAGRCEPWRMMPPVLDLSDPNAVPVAATPKAWSHEVNTLILRDKSPIEVVYRRSQPVHCETDIDPLKPLSFTTITQLEDGHQQVYLYLLDDSLACCTKIRGRSVEVMRSGMYVRVERQTKCVASVTQEDGKRVYIHEVQWIYFPCVQEGDRLVWNSLEPFVGKCSEALMPISAMGDDFSERCTWPVIDAVFAALKN